MYYLYPPLLPLPCGVVQNVTPSPLPSDSVESDEEHTAWARFTCTEPLELCRVAVRDQWQLGGASKKEPQNTRATDAYMQPHLQVEGMQPTWR